MADTRTLTIKFKAEGGEKISETLRTIEKRGNAVYTKILKDGKLVSESTKTIIGAHKNHYGAITALSTGYLALNTAYGAAKSGLDGLIGAGIEELDSIRNRDTALKNAGDRTLKYKDALEKQAEQFMDSLGVADDYTREIQKQLLIQHKAPADIEMMTRATIGLTLQQDMSSEAAAKAIGKFVELGGSLRGTSLKADAHSTAQQRMKQAVDFTTTGIEAQQKKMKENEGEIDRARVKYGELRETLGLQLLPVVSKVAKEFGKLLDWYNGLDPGAQNVVLWGAAAALGFKPVVDALKAITTAVGIISGSAVGRAIIGIGASGAATAGALGLAGAVAVPYKLGDPEFVDPNYMRQQRGNAQDAVNYMRGPVVKVHGPQFAPYIQGMMNAPAVDQYGRPMDISGNPVMTRGMMLNKSFGQAGLGSVAGSFLSGGFGSALSTAGGMAGNALLPGIGGVLGGWLGGKIGGLFGGHKKQNRDGQTQATAFVVQSQQLEDIKTAILRIAPQLRVAGQGLNASMRQIATQGAR